MNLTLNSGDSINVKGRELSILSIFGKENLENIQQKMSKATGIAFVTVDFKGTPVTEMTYFTEFCQNVRRDERAKKVCMASDALGGIQAAITQKPYVYFCPCGLLEIAIPIIIEGTYLGGFIGGQKRCFDAPNDTSDLKTVLKHEKDYRNDPETKSLFDAVSSMKYKQFVDFVELISLIVNQLAEKEMSKLSEKEYLNKEIEILKDKRKTIELQNSLKRYELIALRAKMNPYFLLRSLNTISNLSVIENAYKTNEMIVMLSNFFKYNLLESGNMVPVYEEMDNIERYLEIQQVHLGDRLKYSIHMDESVHSVIIPCLTILPYVEKAMFFSVFRTSKNGLLEINVKDSDKYIRIEIYDNGTDADNNKPNEKYKIYNGDYEDITIENGIKMANQRLVACYGNDFSIEVQNVGRTGRRTIIICPQKSDERIV